MAPARRGAWKLLRSTDDPAITRFDSCSLKGFAPDATAGGPGGAPVRDGLRLFLLKPETGRTHQLRVALKSLGAPVLGDALYGAAADAVGEDRMCLHAAALRLRLDGEAIQAVAPPEEGAEFCAPACAAALAALLPSAGDLGPWFASQKLLRSELPPAGDAG
jgi:tRNA pseudouridine32 synthase/23S rRNA pseudouridine746 synthase